MKHLFFLGFLFFSLTIQAAPKTVRSYQAIVDFMASVNQAYPQDTELFDLGLADSGRMIKGIKIGKGSTNHLLVATHHGNEYGSTAVATAFIKEIAAAPSSGITYYVIPVLNIAGYEAAERHEPDAKGNWRDPNRDYPGPCGTKGPFLLRSTKALAELMKKVSFVASATLHTFHPGVLYPWGISTHDVHTPYTDQFIQMGKAATFLSKYPVANSTLELYPVEGAFEDYAFWAHGAWSLLFELGGTHSPSKTQMEKMAKENVPGLRKMFETAPPVPAPDHAFKGECNRLASILDRGDE